MKSNDIDSCELAIDHFPEQQDAIRSLFQTDPRFRKLCDDYCGLAKAMEFWDKAPLCEAPKRKQEHQTLLAELEVEILKYLGRANNTLG